MWTPGYNQRPSLAQLARGRHAAARANAPPTPSTDYRNWTGHNTTSHTQQHRSATPRPHVSFSSNEPTKKQKQPNRTATPHQKTFIAADLNKKRVSEEASNTQHRATPARPPQSQQQIQQQRQQQPQSQQRIQVQQQNQRQRQQKPPQPEVVLAERQSYTSQESVDDFSYAYSGSTIQASTTTQVVLDAQTKGLGDSNSRYGNVYTRTSSFVEPKAVRYKSGTKRDKVVLVDCEQGGGNESFFRALAIGMCNRLQDCPRDADGRPYDDALQMAEDCLLLGLKAFTCLELASSHKRYKKRLAPIATVNGEPWYKVGLNRATVISTWGERVALVKGNRFETTWVDIEAAADCLARPIIVLQDSTRPHYFRSDLIRDGVDPIIVRYRYGCSEGNGRYYGVRQAVYEPALLAVDVPSIQQLLRAIDQTPAQMLSACAVQGWAMANNFPSVEPIRARRALKARLRWEQQTRDELLARQQSDEEEDVGRVWSVDKVVESTMDFT